MIRCKDTTSDLGNLEDADGWKLEVDTGENTTAECPAVLLLAVAVTGSVPMTLVWASAAILMKKPC